MTTLFKKLKDMPAPGREYSFDWNGLTEEECWERIRHAEAQIGTEGCITSKEFGEKWGFCRRRKECAATKL